MGSRRTYAQGQHGERLAGLWLSMKGYRFLDRRFKCPQGEIDLIVKRGQDLCFVEVKTHKSFENAAWAVSPKQKQRIAKAALFWLARQSEVADLKPRFDVILISKLGKGWPLHHIKNAWGVDILGADF